MGLAVLTGHVEVAIQQLLDPGSLRGAHRLGFVTSQQH